MKSDVAAGTLCDDDEVGSFIASHRASQLYHTATWRKIVESETRSSAASVVTRNTDGKIVGWMPLFMKQGPIGVVANSSPYFGSHGGVLANSAASFDATLKTALDYLKNKGVMSLNVIHPLKDGYSNRYADAAPIAGETARVAHVKSLEGMNDRNILYESLAGLTRSNLRRKCWKSGIAVKRDESETAVSQLLYWHQEQMRAMGAPPKSRAFFEALLHDLEGDSVEGRLYVGRLGDNIVAVLFVCVWREWIEYLTPAFDLGHRGVQPLTAVIFDAMLDCARDGLKYWNFGGSGKDLSSVKAFKETWNGENVDYRYYIIDTGRAEDVKRYAQEHGNVGYDGYFLYPF